MSDLGLVEFVEEVGGLYFRTLLLPQAHTWVPQHVHPYDHVTFCASGSAILHTNGAPVCTVLAGHAVEVKANKEHAFESLEPDTRLTCIHDTRSAQFIKHAGV